MLGRGSREQDCRTPAHSRISGRRFIYALLSSIATGLSQVDRYTRNVLPPFLFFIWRLTTFGALDFYLAFISPYGIESTEARRSKSFRIAEKPGVKCREAKRSTTVDAWVANMVGAKKLGRFEIHVVRAILS